METTKTMRAQVCATPNRDTVACAPKYVPVYATPEPDRVIYLSDAGKVKLRQLFRTSRITVWKALTYKTHSAMARKIRHVALTQLGGVQSPWMPECETTHEESAGTMTQTWGTRVKLVSYRDTGDVILYVDGKKEKEVKDISYHDFLALQQEVELKAMTM